MWVYIITSSRGMIRQWECVSEPKDGKVLEVAAKRTVILRTL